MERPSMVMRTGLISLAEDIVSKLKLWHKLRHKLWQMASFQGRCDVMRDAAMR